ncbi:MAG: hypothetical protein FJ316_11340 [SAR202 cluster bacterium]|nr:hypothetical protein [SAR202 cluster bacterium]
MVKVSITLPNNAQVTVEAEESEVAHGIVGMVLRDLPLDLLQPRAHENGNGHAPTARPEPAPAAAAHTAPGNGLPESPEMEKAAVVRAARELDAEQSERFIRFCQAANPLGDMRRVVVAAEGARRFLGQPDVDMDSLGALFDLAGWRRPHSFTQTLRNAARSKFRWLERVPGRAGSYTVTEAGRAAALDGS